MRIAKVLLTVATLVGAACTPFKSLPGENGDGGLDVATIIGATGGGLADAGRAGSGFGGGTAGSIGSQSGGQPGGSGTAGGGALGAGGAGAGGTTTGGRTGSSGGMGGQITATGGATGATTGSGGRGTGGTINGTGGMARGSGGTSTGGAATGGSGTGGAGTGGAGTGGATCSSTQHMCSGACVDNNSIAHCGSLCDACTPPAGGTATCDGARCDFTCGTLRKCPTKCTSGCCVDGDCPLMAGMAGKCDTSTNTCSYTCAAGFKPCGAGTCIPMANCCTAADCPGACRTCSTTGSCVAVTNADDPDSCAGTCDAAGACKSKRGQVCTSVAGGCVAGTTCAPDGICCDRPCTNSCEACDLVGFAGTCTPLASGPPHGNRVACAGSGTACAGSCAGLTTGLCSYPTGTCGSPTCSGTNRVGAGTCSSGACTPPTPQSCGNNFVCSGAGSCSTTCANGFNLCGSTCIAASGCCMNADCTNRPPNSTPICSLNQCANTCVGATLTCPGASSPNCGSWDFESQTLEGWTVLQPSPAAVGAPAVSTSHPVSGTHSLSVRFVGDGVNSSGLSLNVRFCNQGSVWSPGTQMLTVNLFAVSDAASSPLSSARGSVSFSSGANFVGQSTDFDFVENVATTITLTNNAAANVMADGIILLLNVGAPWRGTVFLDDVQIN